MNFNSRIGLISLFACIGVIWWHCFCGSTLERWFIPSFCTWSVPWFFVVSGVFFAHSIDRHGVYGVWMQKIKTLFIPYCVWCLIGLAISWTIVHFDSIGEVLAFSCGTTHPVGNKALWYVRSLMVFMIVGGMVSLITSRLLRCKRIVFVILFLVLIRLLVRTGLSLGPGSSPFYFSAGFLLSEFMVKDNSNPNIRTRRILGSVFLFFALSTRITWFLLGYDYFNMGGTVLANISVIGLISSLWFFDLGSRIWSSSVIATCCSVTAFVYFMHYPCQDMIKVLARGINRDALFIALVVLSPVLYFLCAIFAKKYIKKIYNFLSGGR